MAKRPRQIIRETADGKRFRRLVQQLRPEPHVKEGYPIESSETDADHDGVTNLLIAAVHEFGTDDGRIPQRSHIRSYFDEERKKIERFAASKAGQVLDGRITLRQALEQIGLLMLSLHKKKIRSSIPPPNAPSTIARKGSDKTLIDTGQMLNSSTTKVIMK